MVSSQVNGDLPNSTQSSAFIQHLLNYPVISDGVDTFKSNEYGQRSIKLGDAAYQTFAAPLLPWFAKPYQYVSPYVQKADTLGDKTLDQLDERFPVVKKPTNDLYNETRGLILLPYTKGLEGKDHVFGVYEAEYKKTEQAGLVAHGRAAVTTVLVVSNETLTWLSSFLQSKKTKATQAVNDKINQ
ncbi:hypothetical protein BGZ63DRAFT_13309 [Mariannaea sp. PMI_226]|nr:hypothetical protein BGZ63DRAFT_13309 [Mariannaea sp. PMI_226]